MDEGYTELCGFDEIKEGEGRRFLVSDTELAVFKVNNRIYALTNVCPHQHTSLIYSGFIEDDCVVCPMHGWKFKLISGRQPDGQKGLDSFPVHVENDRIYVKVSDKKFKW